MTIGAIYEPMRGELYASLSGAGAACNGRPMRVSTLTDIRSATVELGWSTRRPMKQYVTLIDQLTSTGAGFRRGSASFRARRARQSADATRTHRVSSCAARAVARAGTGIA